MNMNKQASALATTHRRYKQTQTQIHKYTNTDTLIHKQKKGNRALTKLYNMDTNDYEYECTGFCISKLLYEDLITDTNKHKYKNINTQIHKTQIHKHTSTK